MREVRLAIFDLDGTLIDSAPEITRAVNRLRSRHSLEALPVASIAQAIGHGVDDLLSKVFEPTEDVAKMQRARTEFGEIYLDEVGRELALYPGTLEQLVSLRNRGLKLALVTNKPALHTAKTLRHPHWRDVKWDFVAGGDTFPEKKPSPLPLLEACRAVGVSPESSAMIGDGRPDMLAARSAGILGLGVDWGYGGRAALLEAGAQHLLSTWQPLEPLLGLEPN
jgi:phosphoglycolate phosphatase